MTTLSDREADGGADLRPGAPVDRHPRSDPLEGLRRLGANGAERPARGGPDRRGRGGAHHRQTRFTRRWPRRALLLANAASALTILIAAAGAGYVEWRFGQLNRVTIGGLSRQGHSAQSANDGSSVPPFTLLVIGTDSRNLGAGGGSQFGSTADVSGQRSDSIILVRVVPKTRSLALLSIPRDTLVPVPGHGTTRINVAFNSGTPALLVSVLSQDFGIQVNHVVEFNFDTFRAVANAVGGVEQYFPAPARDAFSLLNIPAAGCYNLTGDQALAFVRSREYEYYLNGEWHYQLYPESDLARIQRQQAFVRGLVRKARAIAPTNILEMNSIIGSITKNLTIDSAFSNSLILDLAKDYRSADLSTIPSFTFPAVNSQSVPGALDPQFQAGQAVIQQWLSGGQTAPPAPAPGPKTPAPPTTVVAPGDISIEVMNGSGIGGQASAAGRDLAAAGYKVTVSGDAPTFGLATTEIEYAPDSLAAAQQLQSELGSAATLVESTALTPSPYNLEVVTGRDFSGMAPGLPQPGSVQSPSTTTTIPSPAYAGTATVDPASSSIYHGLYVPPGLTAGQIPRTCPS